MKPSFEYDYENINLANFSLPNFNDVFKFGNETSSIPKVKAENYESKYSLDTCLLMVALFFCAINSLGLIFQLIRYSNYTNKCIFILEFSIRYILFCKFLKTNENQNVFADTV